MSATLIRDSFLARIPWIRHGFGTRQAGDWTAASPRVTLKQIHSAHVVCVQEAPPGTDPWLLGEGDALVTDRSGFLLVIRTADCLPILIASERPRAVAAVHAGWRGTAAGIVANAVSMLRHHYGADPAHLRVAMGPGIGGCCYQVGADVALQFRHLLPEWQGPNLDLFEANRRILLREGVAADRVSVAGECTHCRPDRYHSWRRDRSAGRMVSAIGIR